MSLNLILDRAQEIVVAMGHHSSPFVNFYDHIGYGPKWASNDQYRMFCSVCEKQIYLIRTTKGTYDLLVDGKGRYVFILEILSGPIKQPSLWLSEKTSIEESFDKREFLEKLSDYKVLCSRFSNLL